MDREGGKKLRNCIKKVAGLSLSGQNFDATCLSITDVDNVVIFYSNSCWLVKLAGIMKAITVTLFPTAGKRVYSIVGSRIP